MTGEQEIAEIWRAAEARRDSDQPPISTLTQLTEAEVDRAHELGLEIQAGRAWSAEQARARLLKKHALRRATA